jgi:hypothetical protein
LVTAIRPFCAMRLLNPTLIAPAFVNLGTDQYQAVARSADCFSGCCRDPVAALFARH